MNSLSPSGQLSQGIIMPHLLVPADTERRVMTFSLDWKSKCHFLKLLESCGELLLAMLRINSTELFGLLCMIAFHSGTSTTPQAQRNGQLFGQPNAILLPRLLDTFGWQPALADHGGSTVAGLQLASHLQENNLLLHPNFPSSTVFLAHMFHRPSLPLLKLASILQRAPGAAGDGDARAGDVDQVQHGQDGEVQQSGGGVLVVFVGAG